MNKIYKILIFIMLGILQLTLMPFLAIKDVEPNLILIGSIILILTDYEEDAFYLAAFGGLILDLAGPFFFGFNTIFLVGFIFLIRLLLQKNVAEINILLVMIGIFIFSSLFSVLQNIFLGHWPGMDIFLNGLYSAFIGFLVSLFLQRWPRKILAVK